MPFVETRRTPDLDGMALEDYHQSIAKCVQFNYFYYKIGSNENFIKNQHLYFRMNSSLQDIQSDIARLASQQNQIQANQIMQQQVYQTKNPQSLVRLFSLYSNS